MNVIIDDVTVQHAILQTLLLNITVNAWFFIKYGLQDDWSWRKMTKTMTLLENLSASNSLISLDSNVSASITWEDEVSCPPLTKDMFLTWKRDTFNVIKYKLSEKQRSAFLVVSFFTAVVFIISLIILLQY